ncbi:glycoside hydrolase family 15 protein [Arthrobacter sp. ZGTC131]|uniref:glycoside hydrolase family 15 protein n=1 Tax=Arthrobacter sp. ZGTC131 TaxID=2058898 RepID=UPI000CE3DB92|nr:glycoside hydrolase family 15 protein [Arthrobacter sp. ZGTC131]
MSSEPIADYALLSDCCSGALVSVAGSVDWLCFPRFDSPSVFGRILGAEAGFWSIRPADAYSSTRRYLGPTLVLETTHTTDTGCVTVTDALALGDGRRGHELGADSPGCLLRQVSCTQGSVDVDTVFCARPDYGLTRPMLSPADGGLLVRAGDAVLSFSTPADVDLMTDPDADSAQARLTLRAGDVVGFALHSSPARAEAGGRGTPVFWSQEEIARRLEDTVQGWTSWSAMHQNYCGPWQELVAGSGRILQALSYYPSGAIVAAPTTSLPEVAGGTRNWDYRYSWIRDASMTLQALWVAACPDEAGTFFQFLATAAAGQLAGGEDLQIMFGIGGERQLPERELAHLPGWRASAPVRVGNGAWNQRQLDVYGELLDAAATLPEYLAELAPETRMFLADAADMAAARWRSADHGIWEVRGDPRHYLHSKLMCWVAVDRAISLAGILQAIERVPRWMEARDAIAASIRAEGWSRAANAYTQAYGCDDLDASALMLSIVGFLPADDPGIVTTIEAIEERLTDHRGLVYRYLADDGMAGEEGTFLLCTFWLAHALALAGRTQRARAVFERAAAFATDLGLMAEEVAPDSGELLGNFPQAFSHIGLINAAWAISRAEDRAAGP